MLGNDIVDLQEAQKSQNWQNSRFLEKLFTLKEQHLIIQSENSFETIWHFWSMKEAAYKLYVQTNPCRFYNPKAFECSFSKGNSKVRFKNFECFVETIKTSDYIVSEARLKGFKISSEIIQLKKRDHKSQSIESKMALLQHISKHHRIPILDLKLQKSEYGIPFVNCKHQKFHISISHHGNYGAFALA